MEVLNLVAPNQTSLKTSWRTSAKLMHAPRFLNKELFRTPRELFWKERIPVHSIMSGITLSFSFQNLLERSQYDRSTIGQHDDKTEVYALARVSDLFSATHP